MELYILNPLLQGFCTIKLLEYFALILFLTFVQWCKSEIKLILPLLPLPLFVFPIFRNPQQSLPLVPSALDFVHDFNSCM